MNEAERSIRESLLSTLGFLASRSQQIAFAARIHYAAYQDEFACWWFDTYYPDRPEAKAMFTPLEQDALRRFSDIFESAATALENRSLSIHSLQSTCEWSIVVAAAIEAEERLRSAA